MAKGKKTSADLPVKVLISIKVNAGHCKSLRVITTFDQYLKKKLKSFMTELISLPESIEISERSNLTFCQKFEVVLNLLRGLF